MDDASRAKKGGPVAYMSKMAAALSGATTNQLRHWRRETDAGVVLSSYRLVTDGRTIQFVGDDEAIDLVGMPGQRQVVIVMGDVIEPFPGREGVVAPHLFR